MTVPAIEVQNLERYFDDIHALRGLSFKIEAGQVVGFIGANGAGKTTTMRILVTLDTPTSGSAQICGHDVREEQDEVRKRIGWMPDSYGAYEYMTVLEYLDFYARAFHYSASERRRRVEEVLEFAELGALGRRYTNTLSKGMGQRLCLARMLIPDPDVLVMDEPAAGLDPKARVEFKHLVRILAGSKKTIFLSSHILSELEDMCDHILFIDAGKLVHHGSTESLREHSGTEVTVRLIVAKDVERLNEWVKLQPEVRLLEELKGGARLVVCNAAPELLASFLRRTIEAGFEVIDFHREQKKLEDAFIELLSKREK